MAMFLLHNQLSHKMVCHAVKIESILKNSLAIIVFIKLCILTIIILLHYNIQVHYSHEFNMELQQ